MPVTAVATCGVRNFGCTAPKAGGSSPCRAIVRKMRACARIITRITDVRPASAPTITQSVSQLRPACACSATATGAASFSCGYGTMPVSTPDIRM